MNPNNFECLNRDLNFKLYSFRNYINIYIDIRKEKKRIGKDFNATKSL